MEKGYKRIRAKWTSGGKFEGSRSIKYILEAFNKKMAKRIASTVLRGK